MNFLISENGHHSMMLQSEMLCTIQCIVYVIHTQIQ